MNNHRAFINNFDAGIDFGNAVFHIDSADMNVEESIHISSANVNIVCNNIHISQFSLDTEQASIHHGMVSKLVPMKQCTVFIFSILIF
jgi:hypothetical protein